MCINPLMIQIGEKPHKGKNLPKIQRREKFDSNNQSNRGAKQTKQTPAQSLGSSRREKKAHASVFSCLGRKNDVLELWGLEKTSKYLSGTLDLGSCGYPELGTRRLPRCCICVAEVNTSQVSAVWQFEQRRGSRLRRFLDPGQNLGGIMATLWLMGSGCMLSSAGSRSHASFSSWYPSLHSVRLASDAANRKRAICGRASKISGSGYQVARNVVVRASRRGKVDDLGVVKDAELRLDDLSLEYESVWDTKPAWCQPWTIVGTGVGVVSTSWILLHNVFVTGGATIFVSLWWFSFLYAYPLAYSEMIAERRRMVEDAREDPYGQKRVD